ncbi:ferrichrome ABC transporter substrate-binding protein [Vibrio navarrensis]|uniref:Ferrichrome ABC transporter substrate-binding protein n=1 Tax=Vibrio navarrensis TaxID=29495 RepID=A0AAI9CTJ8_9VIBR|nr:ferrichrome ABC transporter substrate-binding protein [Vibrio navarrensis]EHA1126683.1 ferrichrome ABC transporter substrate-binding protein [Vibrio navarrensis]EJL6395473.1 ferrichrome ABC transporter substrate-binding protein [Vibrio navarrensis]EKA5637521.1 ferrichrome ABC transporter substrate-binding protein [Vibrio navarrensis]ELN6932115.1 ferrichrome ABC transporter substrate-binding protein [Vibrio navarrensis]
MKKTTITLLMSCLLLTKVSAAAPNSDISPYALRYMQQAQTLSAKEQNQQAIEHLLTAEVSRPGDVAAISRMLGILYWQSEQAQHSVMALEKALNAQGLADDEQWRTRRMLSSIYLTLGQFRQALPHLELLTQSIPEGENAAEVWLHLAQAHYSLEQWRETLLALEKQRKLDPKPSVAVLSISLGAHAQLEQWSQVVDNAKQLIALQPEKKIWWMQAYSGYLNLRQQKAALDILTLAQLKGITLLDSELKSLAYLYASQGIYEKAAVTLSQLEQADSDLELIRLQAQYWQAAKEWQKSLHFWHKAAEIESKYHWEVAVLQNQLQKYQQVIASLDQMENQQRFYDAQLLKVNALYRLNRLEAALALAKKADAIKSSTQTQSWVRFLSHKKSETPEV